MIRLLALVGALLLATGCFPVRTPLRTSTFDGASHDTVVLLLPGFAASDRTFERKQIVAALREAGLTADLVSANAHYGYYVKGELIPRLREDVIDDLAARYEHVWVLGISMGGLGALLTAQAFPETVDGVILLSPYLGRQRTIDAIRAAGGPAAWTPPAEPMWDEAMWAWLRRIASEPDALPPIWLGYGDRDLSPENLAWFAGFLPPARVRVVPGGHAWSTWRALVDVLVREELLDRPAFAADAP